MNFATECIKRPVATTLLTLGLVLAGSFAYLKLPVASLPQIDFPTITVFAGMPGASPNVMAARLGRDVPGCVVDARPAVGAS